MIDEKKDMSCVRVRQLKSSDVVSSERHNERKNISYSNINIVSEMTENNIHFKDPGNKTYMETLLELEKNSKLSRRGLRADATLFDEIIIDVNTMYFARNGGYEYARQFYEEAYRFLEKKFGSDYIISAVMHADELNKAATDELGSPTYHYHLHVTVIPVVDKEIPWSKRCKDPALRGTVKEVIHQVSHSKKWASNELLKDEMGNTLFRSDGRPKYRASYSILQDEFIEHMRTAGYLDIDRGVRGSTAEHLSSLQFQIEKDKVRLEQYEGKIDSAEEKVNDLEEKIQAESLEYDRVKVDRIDYYDIDSIRTNEYSEGKINLKKDDYEFVQGLAFESVTSRSVIRDSERKLIALQAKYNRLADRYNTLAEMCRPFLIALRMVPDIISSFVEKLLDRLGIEDLNRVRTFEETVDKIDLSDREKNKEDIRY